MNQTQRMTIGHRIAALRKERKMTQEELSSKSGINRANIAKIENGRYNVSIDILNKICDALGCTININEL